MPSEQVLLPPELAQSLLVPVGQQPWPAHASVRLSSTVPSQSSSLPLHVSSDGPTEPEHTSAPFWHRVTPDLHCPTQLPICLPGQRSAHAIPTPGTLSSTRPLQLSSTPLHSSGIGPTTWVQVSPPGPGPI